ncbi:flagellar M-ring protein FliF [Thermoclostridium stercorarium subsp. leptospartum DSM 9219]|uniref:Flagellar M-ring protein FliF n=1 Tax=Thermoclostridium stercorarium subsp. leptospartum DSM 9219 TaxID=1346611 RepID=A0A1B1YIF9_THEST|nr:flagellar M-ring protein FliF C-terminal domain-containing protein [Thermoclostridium stercorarium]ANX00555.1 flagellar M-ring protein FliF [Thermoclostridium stercorarium subsp. leptospartum DSM 9219]
MPEGLVSLWNKIKDYWNDLDKSQKTRIFITAGIITAAVVVTLFFVLRTEYVPLLESGNEYDLKAIVQYLDSHGIKYKKGENQIYVDSRKKQDIEFDLASEAGLLSPDVIFDKSWSKLSLTVTEEDKEKLWKQFEENNLVYKLKKFENVVDASVQYTKPEKTYWAYKGESGDKGSAFVALKTKAPLTAEQIEAAARVVAASIGIPKENITIVDENLNPLNINRDSDMYNANTQEELRRQRELELEQKVYNHFKIGIAQNAFFDTMSVTVSAKLDFDVLNSTEIQYSAPDSDGEGFIKTRETLEEKSEGSQSGAAPGIDSNPGTATYQIGSGGTSSYKKEHNIEERIYNEKQIESKKALGKLVPEEKTATITLWYGHRVENADALTSDFIEQIKQDAGYAMGIPTSNISVSIQKLAPEVVADIESNGFNNFVEKYGLYVLMAILLGIMALLMIPKGRKAAEQEVPLALDEAALAGAELAVEDTGKQRLPEIDFEEKDELKRQIQRYVEAKPEAVAQLLRNWLAEDWD